MSTPKWDGTYPEELPGEDWRPLPPPHGDWLVSNCGRIWAMKWGKLLSAYQEHRPAKRLVVRLPSVPGEKAMKRTSGGRYSYRQTQRQVAVAVLEAFVGPRPGPHYGALCKDGDETNCHVDNLEWAVMPQMRPRGGTSKRQQQRLAQQAREAAT